eukprot:Lankesteria_metandrocarpae@DN4687_c0_g1_i1.p1
MSLVGQQAPDFTCTAVMPDGSFKEVSLEKDYKDKSVCLFFWPLDFSFVCPSELLAFNKAVGEFQSRGVELLGCSIDSQFSHWAYRELPVEKGGIGKIAFPLLSDLKKDITAAYGITHAMGVALRGTFIMNSKHSIMHACINDLPIGRSVDETLRVVDAIQYHEKHGEVCPANWKKGEKAMKATQQGTAEYLAANYKK